MENRPGFIKSEMDLKVLILFILCRLPEPVHRDALTETTLLCDNAIGYFDFTDCLADLVRTGHISAQKEFYSITEKGRLNGEATESGIPYSVRIRAERAAATLAAALQRDSMIKASHELRARGGFTVHLSMSDGIGPVLSLDLLTGDDRQSKAMEANFRDHAESIYARIVDLLLEGSDGDPTR